MPKPFCVSLLHVENESWIFLDFLKRKKSGGWILNSTVLQPHQDLIGGKSRAVLNQQVDTTRGSVHRERMEGSACVNVRCVSLFKKGKRRINTSLVHKQRQAVCQPFALTLDIISTCLTSFYFIFIFKIKTLHRQLRATQLYFSYSLFFESIE
jgi:hypothetical protein